MTQQNLPSEQLQFIKGLERLDMIGSNSRLFHFITEMKDSPTTLSSSEWFSLEKAAELGATGVYFRKFSDGSRQSIPQIYVYDYTQSQLVESDLADIHKKIWSSGNVPLVYIFSRSEVKIFDCTKPAQPDKDGKSTPNYLEDHLLVLSDINDKINLYSASNFDNGYFWEIEENANKFSFSNSVYTKLLEYLKHVFKSLKAQTGMTTHVAQKLIVQSILVKYLEEREGEDGSKVFPTSFFEKYGEKEFCDILRSGKCLDFFDDLNKSRFNGKIFEWAVESDRAIIIKQDLSLLANFLDASNDPSGQTNLFNFRYYSFSHLPVELISRLYEEFLGNNEEGLIYTPPHLANLLVDECMSINMPPSDLDFKILDPSCGSGIFLVTAFKRIVQWWRIKNNYQRPSLDTLKSILKNCIHGVDIADQAVQLSRFSLSLALCDLLTPREIWQNLKFDDAEDGRFIEDDFFNWASKEHSERFDLIIGNPPFIRGKLSKDEHWKYSEEEFIAYPQNDISYKFLTDSLSFLKEGGVQCLIMPAGLLYNSGAQSFRRVLFEHYNVIQIFDFSALARNKVLWDNSDVSTVAVFSRCEKPNLSTNILHLTLKRTKATKERILFEIDEYDFHYVSREEASENPFIWKANLLGGGRIKSLLSRFASHPSLSTIIDRHGWKSSEGLILGTTKNLKPSQHLRGHYYLPTESFSVGKIDVNKLKPLPDRDFHTIPNDKVFTPPNILIKEIVLDTGIAVAFNDERFFAFKAKIVGIHAELDQKESLLKVFDTLNEGSQFYKFYLYCTSGQLLISKNTAILKEDIMNLPIPANLDAFNFSSTELNLISDVNNLYQDFLRHGERGHAVRRIKDIDEVISFGHEFMNALNLVYKNGEEEFKQSDIIFTKHFICSTFTFSESTLRHKVYERFDDSELLVSLFNSYIHSNLRSTRTLRIYRENSVFLIKPNQKRYWMKSIAYRDSDKTFADLVKSGY